MHNLINTHTHTRDRTEIFILTLSLLATACCVVLSVQTVWQADIHWSPSGTHRDRKGWNQYTWPDCQIQPRQSSCRQLLSSWMGWLCAKALCKARTLRTETCNWHKFDMCCDIIHSGIKQTDPLKKFTDKKVNNLLIVFVTQQQVILIVLYRCSCDTT